MKFIKYSSSGNDFLIFHTYSHDDGSRSTLAQEICERHNGIGADGMVAIIPAKCNDYAYEWEFYNADGSCANMCGNASRSVGHYAYTEGLAPIKHSFLSAAGIINVEVDKHNNNLVQSDLGTYKLLQDNITESNPYNIHSWDLVDTGVPHLVGFVKQKGDLPNGEDNKILHSMRMKYDANISIAFIDKQHILYLTYERGVEDITRSCGTGSAAVFAMALKNGLNTTKAKLIPPSKDVLELSINEDSHILLKGPVKRIARCEYFS